MSGLFFFFFNEREVGGEEEGRFSMTNVNRNVFVQVNSIYETSYEKIEKHSRIFVFVHDVFISLIFYYLLLF